MDSTKNIYAIYASQDSGLALNLLRRMKLLEKDFNVSIWQDDPIYPGQSWNPQNVSLVDQADIFLFLISDAFMHSEFIKQDEFKMIIDRYKAGKAIVIPVLLDNCPWDINFNSEDYNFNFRELQVLPVGEKPISEWNLADQPLKHVTDQVQGVITSFTKKIDTDKPNENFEKKIIDTKREEQIALNFREEEKAKRVADEAKRLLEETATKRKAEEEKRSREEAEAKKRIEEKNRLKEEAETKRRAEAEQRLKEETEIKRRAAEEKRRADEREAKRRAEEEARRKEAALAKKRIEEENSIAAEAYQAIPADEASELIEENTQEKSGTIKKGLLAGFFTVALVIAGIWAFTEFKADPEKNTPALPDMDVTNVDSNVSDDTKTDSGNQAGAILKLGIGDTYKAGIIFTIDWSNKTGKIAYTEDSGPMPWKNAMDIHEQLGEGWRLPTLDELQLMYQTIGQGATNSGQFADELYWSATPFDENQARLVRFTDGNTSYHYNSRGTHRKFRVRAIKDFSR